jgi:hypothetical protein
VNSLEIERPEAFRIRRHGLAVSQTMAIVSRNSPEMDVCVDREDRIAHCQTLMVSYRVNTLK